MRTKKEGVLLIRYVKKGVVLMRKRTRIEFIIDAVDEFLEFMTSDNVFYVITSSLVVILAYHITRAWIF